MSNLRQDISNLDIYDIELIFTACSSNNVREGISTVSFPALEEMRAKEGVWLSEARPRSLRARLFDLASRGLLEVVGSDSEEKQLQYQGTALGEKLLLFTDPCL
ncbi:MAG TPA: hypothetical protein PK513_01455 [Alphaproteobacteria bacterium]|nr:hypothetical protein [Alphaproteobacteria bacterium]USO06343.1 MAG: hypothetical protein H6859_03910 [Rhodospirillales bacterium]HOO81150.1 hypothetical protein [Alphaproteobacteria bacterium]